MSDRETHDPRTFRQWVSLDDLGNVLAMHEFETSVDQPLPLVVEVTAMGPKDWTKIDAKTKQDFATAKAVLVADVAKKTGKLPIGKVGP